MMHRFEVNSLRQLTLEIIDPESSIHTWILPIHSLNLILKKHSPFQIDPYKDIGEGMSRLSCGLAVSPTQAALCAREIARTAAFIKGLAGAIEQLLEVNRGKPVRVLYAGCGPYALLAFPLMSVFTPDQVRFTLIDIHPESLGPAEMLIASFGFMDYITDFICADAALFQLPCYEKPDVIITETMNACLAKEPQVMIIRNLFRQAPDALIIPRMVKIKAYLLNLSREFSLVDSEHVGEIPGPNRDRILLGDVFELSRATLAKWKKIKNKSLPAAKIKIPHPLKQRYEPRLLTIINVFDNIYLKDYDCSLTLPVKFTGKEKLKGGENLHFQYKLGESPGLFLLTHLKNRRH